MSDATQREWRFYLDDMIGFAEKEAAEKGRIKRKDPDSKSSKFLEYVPYWA